MYDRDHDLSINEKTREAYWDEKGKRVEWFKPYNQVLDKSRAPLFYSWYTGGEMNIVHNLIDRHVNNGRAQ